MISYYFWVNDLGNRSLSLKSGSAYRRSTCSTSWRRRFPFNFVSDLRQVGDFFWALMLLLQTIDNDGQTGGHD